MNENQVKNILLTILRLLGLFPYKFFKRNKILIINKRKTNSEKLKFSMTSMMYSFVINFIIMFLFLVLGFINFQKEQQHEKFKNTLLKSYFILFMITYINFLIFIISVLYYSKNLANVLTFFNSKIYQKHQNIRFRDFPYMAIFIISFLLVMTMFFNEIYIEQFRFSYIIYKITSYYQIFIYFLYIFLLITTFSMVKSSWNLNIQKILYCSTMKIKKNPKVLYPTRVLRSKVSEETHTNFFSINQDSKNFYLFLNVTIVKVARLNYFQNNVNKIFSLPISMIILDQMAKICVMLFSLTTGKYSEFVLVDSCNVIFSALCCFVLCEISNIIFQQVSISILIYFILNF